VITPKSTSSKKLSGIFENYADALKSTSLYCWRYETGMCQKLTILIIMLLQELFISFLKLVSLCMFSTIHSIKQIFIKNTELFMVFNYAI
jgi:hypothetical protein